MPISSTEPISADAIAQALGYPIIQVQRWQRGAAEMLLDPVQMLGLCQELGITLEQLAAEYINWGASAKS